MDVSNKCIVLKALKNAIDTLKGSDTFIAGYNACRLKGIRGIIKDFLIDKPQEEEDSD